MRTFCSILIPLTIFGVVQSVFVYASDQRLGPPVTWFFILIGFYALFFSVMDLTFKIRMSKLLNIPSYQRWYAARYMQWPLKPRPSVGLMLGPMAGPVVGPIYAIGIAHWWWPQTSGFHAACIGMVVGVVVLSLVGMIAFACFTPPPD